MNGVPVLDTHVWIWWMLGDARLKAAERDALDGLPPDDRPVLCDISLWEFGTLVDLGRVEIEGEVSAWLQVAAAGTHRSDSRVINGLRSRTGLATV